MGGTSGAVEGGRWKVEGSGKRGVAEGWRLEVGGGAAGEGLLLWCGRLACTLWRMTGGGRRAWGRGWRLGVGGKSGKERG